MGDLENQSDLHEMSGFELEYFIQTRKEIDTEKQERNKILNYAVIATGASSVVLARIGPSLEWFAKETLLIYFPLLFLVSVLVGARRMKLRQIYDRWQTLNSLLSARKIPKDWKPLERIVCEGLLGRRYIWEDFILHLGLSVVFYCLTSGVIFRLFKAGGSDKSLAVAIAICLLLHLVVTSIWLMSRINTSGNCCQRRTDGEQLNQTKMIIL